MTLLSRLVYLQQRGFQPGIKYYMIDDEKGWYAWDEKTDVETILHDHPEKALDDLYDLLDK